MLQAATRATTRGAPRALRPRFAVSLFGGFALRAGEQPVTIKNRKAQALLAYLLLNPSVGEPRERLCGLLWSESSEEKARASLRQTLHGLREVLDDIGFDGLQIGRDEVGLAKSDIEVDEWAVVEAAGRGEPHPLVLDREGLPDTLLPGFEDLDPSFRVWLLVQRQALQRQLERYLERALAEAEPGRLRGLATALLNLDPTHEEACRRLMQDYAEQGDTSAALKTYKSLWDLLDEEYGTEPSERTQELVVRIKNNEFKAAQAAPPPPAPAAPEPAQAASEPASPPALPASPGRPARLLEPAGDPLDVGHTFLIVSEFDSSGVTDNFLHLVQGLRHELIAKLVRFREWSVLDGRGLGGDLVRNATVGAKRFSLDATVRQAGQNLQVTLTIKEQPSERYVWSESFVLNLDQWFDLQASVVRRIALALNVHLSTERLMAAARRPEISLSAYDRWLRGQRHVEALRAEDASLASEFFQSIIEEAPEFSPAYSGLAQILNSQHLVRPGIGRSPEVERHALALAKQAAQTDPFDSRAHLCLAWALALSRQFDQAELNFGLALKLNENDAWTLTSASLGLAFCGKHDRAVALANQALELNLEPSRAHWGYQATLRFVCGDYAGCIEAAEHAQESIQNLPGWHAAALAHLGEVSEAQQMGRHFLDVIRAIWQGKEPATDVAISTWFLDAFPMRLKTDRERLRDGLILAKIPVADPVRA